MPKVANTREDVCRAGIRAALELGAEQDWSGITLAAIAEKAELSLADFHGVADKAALSAAVEPWFDEAMSAENIDMSDTPHERLFDVLMLRFEAMEPYRAGLLSLIKWRQQSPARLAELLKARHQTARWALTCAGLDGSADLPFTAKVLNTVWVLIRSERAWRKEESADFSRTMARLDAELRSTDERMQWLDRFMP